MAQQIPPGMIEYLDPAMVPPTDAVGAATVAALRGQWLAIVDNGWKSFAVISARIGALLGERHGIAGLRVYQVPTSPGPPPELFDRIAAECAAAVVGLAN